MAFWSGLKRLGRNRHYHRGIMHYNRGEYAEAVSAFEEALATMRGATGPEHDLGAFYAAEARANLGLARFQRGDDANAEQDFRQALVHNPNYPDLHYALALLCERGGRPGDAAGALERAIAIHPDYLEARLLYAVVLSQLGQSVRAREELERAVALGFELPPGLVLEAGAALGPLDWSALRSKATKQSEVARQVASAVERAQAGDRAGAIDALEKALADEPRFADLRCRLGTLLAEDGQVEQAVEQFEIALSINPRYLEARVRLGLAMLSLGRPMEAERAFTEACGLSPGDPEIEYFRAAARFRAGNLEGALASAESALAHAPGMARAHRLRALCLVAHGRHDEAIASLDRALEHGREWPAAALDAGSLLLDRGKAREATRAFERAVHWEPDTPETHLGLARALIAQGDLPAAEKRLLRAIELDPGCGAAHFRLGGLQRADQRLGDARESFEHALRVVPQWADVWAAHAETCERLGDMKTAEASWRKALGLNPTFTDARVGLAGMLARRGAPEARRLVAEARVYDPLHPRVRALDDARLHELLEEGVSG
jgi:tetratricopeptide (TPR) repeat protein